MQLERIRSLVGSAMPDLIEAVRQTIAIDTVKDRESAGPGAPFGAGVARGLARVLELGASAGMRTAEHEGMVGLVELPGDDDRPDRYVGVLAHIDVVPAGRGWTVGPFSGEIRSGQIWGRGTVDDKGPMISALFAMRILKQAGFRPGRTVRLIVGTDEESGMQDMAWYARHFPPPDFGFTPDAEFPVINAEKGALFITVTSDASGLLPPGVCGITGGTRPNVVPGECHLLFAPGAPIPPGTVTLPIDQVPDEMLGPAAAALPDGVRSLPFTGRPAHGSLPQLGVNAIDLCMDWCAANLPATPLISFYRERLAASPHGEKLGIASEHPVMGRLTTNPGVIRLFPEAGLSLMLDIRFTADDSSDLIQKMVARSFPFPVSMQPEKAMQPLFMPAGHPLVAELSAAWAETTGTPAELLSIGGSTYAKALPNVLAFGPLFPGQQELAHQPDERIGIEDLERMTVIYAAAIRRLASL